jgi:hypothetical protein
MVVMTRFYARFAASGRRLVTGARQFDADDAGAPPSNTRC